MAKRGIDLSKIKRTCPPDLYAMIEQEGSFMKASKAAKMGANTIAAVATGKKEVSPRIQKSFDAYHAKHGGPISADKPSLAEVEIPPWDKKVMTLKVTRGNGKKVTFKKIPNELAELVKRSDNVVGTVAAMLGFSSWGTVWNGVEKGNYGERLHPLVYRVLNGIPLPHSGDVGVADQFKTGLAVCIMTLSEFERIEEIAEVLGGSLTFKMSLGQNWIAIYNIGGRAKLEQFKRLAHRDAKKIVCP